jgi:diguanylate cyclase (GGDEF)-like protein/PAS domain S-box-containing protein
VNTGQTRVLVVEDEGVIALDLKGRLQDLGYSVVGLASSGEQALRKVRQLDPDLVLLDIVIQGPMDGIDTAGRIREHSNIPVIFLTAHSDDATLMRAKATRPHGYLVKPFRPQELRTTIEVALTRSQLETTLRQTQQQLWHEKERVRTTLQSIGDAVLTVDGEGRVDYVNPVASVLLGVEMAEARGMHVDALLHMVDQNTGDRVHNPLHDAVEGHEGSLPARTILLSQSGRVYPIEDSCAPIRDSDGRVTGAVLVFRDVTMKRELIDRISYQARHDALTGLINRREFELMIGNHLKDTQTNGWTHALLYLDLDQFKIVNDTAGHQAGDELLRSLSQLMASKLRKSDVLARLGGDEFGVLLDNCPLDKAREIGESLVAAIGAFRFCAQERVFSVGASVGVVMLTAENRDTREALVAADTACYMAKDKGRGRLEVYRSDNAAVLRRKGENNWLLRLPSALDEGRFSLCVQRICPTQDLHGTTNLWFEVLLRLIETDGELIQPLVFLPAAERYGMVTRIDRWVIRRTLQILRARASSPRPGDALALYSINLSGASISDDQLLEFVAAEFKETGVAPERICYELTETVAIAHMDEARRLLFALKRLGCKFALDDFGNGFSSFSYLKDFPVDFVKIDGRFVRGMTADTFDCAVVEGVNRIGHALGVQTVAEYVEDAETLSRLLELGVDHIQGYVLHRPMPFS